MQISVEIESGPETPTKNKLLIGLKAMPTHGTGMLAWIYIWPKLFANS